MKRFQGKPELIYKSEGNNKTLKFAAYLCYCLNQEKLKNSDFFEKFQFVRSRER